jgi:hypothetical protein
MESTNALVCHIYLLSAPESSLNKNLMATPSLWTQPDRLFAFGSFQIMGLVVPF